jgi:hypothetical protein
MTTIMMKLPSNPNDVRGTLRNMAARGKQLEASVSDSVARVAETLAPAVEQSGEAFNSMLEAFVS